MVCPLVRRASILLLLALPALTSCSPPATTPFDGERAMRHVEFLVKNGPRPAGSKSLTVAADYIQKKLAELGLQPQLQAWREDVPLEGDKKLRLELRNVWVQIDGQDPVNGPILVIGAHYDTKLCQGHPDPAHNFRFVGAIDGTGGPAVLLELARHLKDRQNVPNIWLVWFDGEENVEFDWKDDSKALFGSRHFVKTMATDKARFPRELRDRVKAMILLDLVGDKNPKVDKEEYGDPRLLEIFEAAGDAMGESARMFQTASTIKDDHLAFINYRVPAINLIDFHFRIPAERTPPGQRPALDDRYVAWWHTEKDTPEQMSPFGLKFFGDLVLLALPQLEKHPEFFGAK